MDALGLSLVWLKIQRVWVVTFAAEAVTEGDTGYDYRDYDDAYDNSDFEEASGDVIVTWPILPYTYPHLPVGEPCGPIVQIAFVGLLKGEG